MTLDNEQLVYTVEEARKKLRLSRGLMYEAIHDGQIPSIRIGRRILVPCAALKRLLEKGDLQTGERPRGQ